MGREVRMVSADWQHPKDDKGHYIPLHEAKFAQRLAEWELHNSKWNEGLRDDYKGGWQPIGDMTSASYEEWDGPKPVEEDYMPTFPEGTATHLMMYETCSEGTPISPAFSTPEKLAQWLVENGASAFAGQTADYESWLRVCKGGYAPSAVMVGNVLYSGVVAL
jgi:hypothetical protein